MKIGFYCHDDWANAMYHTAKAVEEKGHTVVARKANPHSWYSEHAQVTVGPPPENNLDVLVLFNTHPGDLRHTTKCPIIVRHGGSVYRQNKDHWLKFWNDKAVGVLFGTEDLLWDYEDPLKPGTKLVKKVPTVPWRLWHNPVDTGSPTPYHTRLLPRVVHLPSNKEVKGTTAIVLAIQDLLAEGASFQFSYLNEPVSHHEALQLIRDADIVIDCINMVQRARGHAFPFGEFGNLAKECAALGRPVITNHQFVSEYDRHYGHAGVTIANTTADLKSVLRGLVNNAESRTAAAHRGLEWVSKNHSYKAAASQLLAFIADVLEEGA